MTPESHMALLNMHGLAGEKPPQPSPLSDSIETADQSPHEPYFHHLAQRVAHNLRHQHQWTTVAMHACASQDGHGLLPRPIISGLPPQRIYVHPDEQIEFLKEESRRKVEATEATEATKSTESTVPTEPTEPMEPTVGEPRPEREWVLPAHLREKWSLKRFAQVFDAIPLMPPDPDHRARGEMNAPSLADTTAVSKWRTTKRLLLATVDDDGTIVYYIVHDGIIKPRQN